MDSAFDDPFFSGGMLGGGMMGGGLMRSMMEDFGSMHGMMENRSEGMERFGTDTGMGGLGGMMRQMGTMAQHGGGSNSFSTQSFCMSSSSNGDGPPKVQRFSQRLMTITFGVLVLFMLNLLFCLVNIIVVF
jgi:hypothetical protein